ncbi:MFS transporter [Plantactinospora sp. BB1]|uniref:MFS transporter n=1 Tax=Plantactinospora sp. BB1 TaxID=2071627 RepID=UPI000D15D4A8|nr:MFS transporter [Plantactinospora sp. BB1]AVT41920.1 MFS transporter [Plantactinospora sp. BB1]
MAGATARLGLGSARRTRFGGFWTLWTATVLSRLGDALRTPALALLAASVSRDPRVVASVVVAGQLPPLLFGLLGGVYADRWDRRRTMAIVDGLRAVLVAGFALLVGTGDVGIVALVCCALLLATLGVVFDAAAFAVLPGIVPADRLAVANGRLQAGTAVAGGFVGAPLAGVLFAVAAALPFAVDAVTFAVAALLALTLRPTPPMGPTPTPTPTPTQISHPLLSAPRPLLSAPRPLLSAPRPLLSAPRPLLSTPRPVGGRGAAWRAAGDGLRWIWRDATMRRITGLTVVTNLATSGLIAIIVLYALEVLAVPAAGYGLFMAAAVFGALVGGLCAGRLATRLGTLPGLRWVLVAETLAVAALAMARHPVPGAIALALFSAGTATWNALWSAYGQRNVPAELLGRVGSAQRTVGLLAAPVGAILAGALGSAAGLPPVLYAATAIFALTTAASWHSLRPTRGTTVEAERSARHDLPDATS